MSDFQTYADSDQMIRAGYSTPLRSCAYQGMLPSMITVTNKRCKLEMTCQSDTPHLKVSSAGVCERNVDRLRGCRLFSTSKEEIIASAGFSVAQSRESGSNKDTMKQEEFHDLLRPIADYIFQQSSSRRADLAIIHDNDWIQICERVVPEQLSQFSQIYLPLFKSWIKNQEPT
ncbi:hypothetical protein ABKN59_010063 [Abortiporus biennis]